MKKICLIFYIISLANLACSQKNQTDKDKTSHNSIVPKVRSMYDLGEKLFESDSLEALEWIQNGIDFSWKEKDDLLAVEGLILRSKLEFFQKRYVKSLNTSLRVLNYDVILSNPLKVKLYLNLADALFNLGAFELSISYRKKISAINSTNRNDSETYYQNENIAYCFSRIDQLDSAEFYYLKSMKLAEKSLDTNLILHCLNNIGYHYINHDQDEKSLEYFNKGIDLFESHRHIEKRDSVIYAMLLVNRSDFFFRQGLNKKVIEEVYKSNEMLSTSDSSFLTGNMLRLSRAFIRDRKLDSAKFYLDVLNTLNKNTLFDEPYLESLRMYYRLSGNEKNARETSDKLIEVLRSRNDDETNGIILDLIESQNEQVKKNLLKETALLKDQNKLTRSRFYIIIFSVSFLIFISIIGFLIWRKKKREVNREKLLLKEREIAIGKKETQKLSEALAFKNHDLTEFGIELSRKNELVKEIILKLKSSKEKDDVLIEVIRLLERHIQVDDSLSVFHDNVEKVNHEFMNKLIENYPNLTINDRQICAMLKLQLSSKEIATLKNISSDSVKKVRYRLRKKMNLPSGVDLSEFFRNY